MNRNIPKWYQNEPECTRVSSKYALIKSNDIEKGKINLYWDFQHEGNMINALGGEHWQEPGEEDMLRFWGGTFPPL